MAGRHTLMQLHRVALSAVRIQSQGFSPLHASLPGVACSKECFSRSTPPIVPKQHRGFVESASSASEHAKAKRDFQRSMRELRRQWLENAKEREQARAVRREAAFARQDRFVQKARQQREVRQAERQVKYKKQMDRLLARKAAQREVSAQWRSARDDIYAELHQRRVMQLTEHSKTWITADDLDARIEYALDNPVRLSGSLPPAEEQKQRPAPSSA